MLSPVRFTGSDTSARPATPQRKPIDISLSKLYQQIMALPLDISDQIIPRKELFQDILEKRSTPSIENQRKQTFDIQLLTRYSLNRQKENDLFLQRSLGSGHFAVFNALMQTTEKPDLAPLLEIAATKNDYETFWELLHTLKASSQEIPLSTFERVAACGQPDKLRKLFDVSTLGTNEKKTLWKLAQQQKEKIREFNALSPDERHDELMTLIGWSNSLTPEGIQRKNLDTLALLQTDLDINQPDRNGYTPLTWASIVGGRGNLEFIKILIQAGANLNVPDPQMSMSSPLHFALANDHNEIAQLLIREGADVNQPNQYGDTPLHSAARRLRVIPLKAILRAGANVDQMNRGGSTPLHLAASGGFTENVRHLIEAGADVNKPADLGRTPLFLAAVSGEEAIVEMLIQAGADVNRADKHNRTPLQVAKSRTCDAIVRLLKEHGATEKATSSTPAFYVPPFPFQGRINAIPDSSRLL